MGLSERMCLKNIIKSHQTQQLYRKNTWNRTIISLKANNAYSYTPQPIEYYDYINDKIGEYYKSQGIREYNDHFLKYVIDNELEQEPLEDNLIDIDDCLLIDFDEHFPIKNTLLNKELFIFDFFFISCVQFLSFKLSFCGCLVITFV